MNTIQMVRRRTLRQRRRSRRGGNKPRLVELRILADGKPISESYFEDRDDSGETGEAVEDAVDKHIRAQGLEPVRRFDSVRGYYDVHVTGEGEIPPLTTTVNGTAFEIRFEDEVSGGRRRRRKTFGQSRRRI